MIELLVVHVLSPVEERSRRNLRQHTSLAEHLYHLLLQIGELVVLGEGKELVDLVHTLNGGDGGSWRRRVGGEVEAIFVQELQHLLEGDRVMGHEGENVLPAGTTIGFCLFDLQSHDSGATQDRLVGVEAGTIWTAFRAELDDEDGGGEVAAERF